jgi:hypothetical protein
MIGPNVAEQLRQRGVDAVALIERALLGTPDAELFEQTQLDGRTIVTYDTDYLALDQLYHAEGRRHRGVVMVSSHRFPQRRQATLGALVRALEALATGDQPQGSFVHWLQ